MNLDRFGALDNLVQFWGSSPGVLFKHAFLFKSAFCCSSCETSTVDVPNSSPFSWSPPHCPSSFCVRYGGDRSPENKGTSKWGKPTNIEQPSWWFQKISEKEERETLEVNAHVGWGLFTKQQSPQLTWIYFKKKEKFRALPLVAQQNQHKKVGGEPPNPPGFTFPTFGRENFEPLRSLESPLEISTLRPSHSRLTTGWCKEVPQWLRTLEVPHIKMVYCRGQPK